MSMRQSSQNREPPEPIAEPVVQTGSTTSDLLPPPPLIGTPRISPRGRDFADMPNDTTFNALRQLANNNNNIVRPSTPLNQTFGDSLPSTHRSIRRTPGTQYHPGSTKRHAAATPHTQAAIREIELRRAAALTPGKGRRRSLGQRRDTPRDVLRALSAVLAPGTNVVEPSPDTKADTNRATKGVLVDSEDEEPALKRPRLSIPLDVEEDEDNSLLLPPIPSTFAADDENLTQRSIELPRRLSRTSFGLTRSSDRFEMFSDVGFDAANPETFDSSFFQQELLDDDQDEEPLDPTFQRNFTGDLRRIFLQDSARQELESTNNTDIEVMQGDDDETTFMLAVPRRDSVHSKHTNPQSSPELRPQDEVDVGSIVEDWSSDSEDLGEQEVDQLYTRERSNFQPQEDATIGNQEGPKKGKKSIRVSKYGIQYPSLPVGTVRKLATTILKGSYSKTKLSKDTLEAVMQASDWFFEQISDDLGVYSEHAGRKTIDESDVLALMKRQRQTSATITPFSLAQRYLPRELLQDFRMPPQKAKGRRSSADLEGQEDI